MNGRSSENNVEIKSKQQVCVVFFFFHIAGPAFCNDRKKREEETGVCEADEWEREEEERERKGGHSVSHASIFLKDKFKTLPQVFTFVQNAALSLCR